tara:strand:- start:272 stop:1522 length:1251 start_codon:yes stop_codon:yes gene_type:complete
MPIAQASFDNIKVGYISETDGYIQDVSLADAREYARLNPDTEFIFIDGDEKVRFLTISEVNALTPKNLLRSDPCLTGDQPCGPPKLRFFGGSGVGANGNPVIDVNGNLIAVDLVSGGFGYTSPPQVQVIDPCNNGSGAVLQTIIENGVVVQVIVKDSGQGYLPPPQTVPQYPAIIELTGVTVTNPGFNHNCGVDTIEIIPSNGTVLSYNCDPFGKIKSVSVDKGGRFTELPQIRMNTETGLNASFVPNFNIIRDPQPVEPVLTDVVQVFDLVGLNINGYVDGKPYYGNVYYVNGIRYAGTSDKSGTNIVVYDTQLASVQKRQIQGQIVASQREETETQEDTIEAISSPTRGTYSTTPTSAPSTTPATPSTTTTPATGGGYSTPSTPAPAPSTPSTPAPPSSSPPSGGGGGGYGGGY